MVRNMYTIHPVTQFRSISKFTKTPLNKILPSPSHYSHPSLISKDSFAASLTKSPLSATAQSVSGSRPPGSAALLSSFANWKGNVAGQRGHRVPGEIKRSRDLRGGRWSWTLTFAQKRSWVGRWCWAEQVGCLLLRVVQVVRQQRCNGHCLNDTIQHSSWKSNCAVHKSLGNGEGTPP